MQKKTQQGENGDEGWEKSEDKCISIGFIFYRGV
jgi:hypothetical protein